MGGFILITQGRETHSSYIEEEKQYLLLSTNHAQFEIGNGRTAEEILADLLPRNLQGILCCGSYTASLFCSSYSSPDFLSEIKIVLCVARGAVVSG